MAVTYRRFLRLKLQADAVSHLLEVRAERISSQVAEEGGLDTFARTMIVQDIGAARVTGEPGKGPGDLGRLSDPELIRELLRAEATA